MKIGLVKREYGWGRILEQEKVPWKIVNLDEDINEYSLIILNFKEISDIHIKKLKLYLNNGGAILTDALLLKRVDKTKKINKIYINSLSGDGNLFRNVGVINIGTFGYKIKNANYGLINKNYNAIYAHRHGKGFIIALPFNLNLLMLDERSKKSYKSPKMWSFPKKTGALQYRR